MQLKTLINEGTKTISSLYPEREAREMVFSCLESILGTSRHTHILEPDYEVSEEKVMSVREAFARMASGEPLQYVTGKAWFYGREFRVTPDVLIPRPETEILCREACCAIRDRGEAGELIMSPKIIDLCTGSGCIAWTVAMENPGTCVTAVDISDGALAVAAGQDFADEMVRTGALKPSFVRADVLAGPSSVDYEPGSFDFLVSNPPYVTDSEKALMRPNVLEHEPHLALFVPDDDPLLFYRAIADWARMLLKPGGFGMVEINEALGARTADIYREAGFEDVHIEKDLNEKDRFVIFRRY